MATHAFSSSWSSSIRRIPNFAFVLTNESTNEPSHRVSRPIPASPGDRHELVAPDSETRSRRAAFRRPGATARRPNVPHARVPHDARTRQSSDAANPAHSTHGRLIPAAIDGSDPTPVTALPRPAQRRRKVPFLTWTRLLLGRDGLAAVSMTGVFAILLFL